MTPDVVAQDAALAAAVGRMRAERESVEARNRELERLVARRTALAEQLDAALTAARAERTAIDAELAAVLAGDTSPRPTRRAGNCVGLIAIRADDEEHLTDFDHAAP